MQRQRIPITKVTIRRFIKQSERLSHVTRLSAAGISSLTEAPELIEATAEALKKVDTEDHKNQLKSAREDAELAQHEIDTGFPLLFSHATVALWSFLELMLRATVVSWLRNEPKTMQNEIFAKLRVRLGEYEQLTEVERLHYIAELLEGEVASGM